MVYERAFTSRRICSVRMFSLGLIIWMPDVQGFEYPQAKPFLPSIVSREFCATSAESGKDAGESLLRHRGHGLWFCTLLRQHPWGRRLKRRIFLVVAMAILDKNDIHFEPSLDKVRLPATQ